MATAVFVSPQEYLRSSFEPDAEYVDGHIEERPVGEFDHASWQDAIQAWFRAHRDEWNLRSRAELRIQMTPTRFRVPDVTVLDRGLPVEQIVTVPPVAIFEILSPEDTVSRLMIRLKDFEAMGVRNIFVVDPAAETFYRFAEGTLSPSNVALEKLEGTAAFLNWIEIGNLRD